MGWGVPACPQNSTVSDNLSDNVWYSAKTTAFYESQEKQQNLRKFSSPPVPKPPPLPAPSVILPAQNQSCRYQKDKFDFYSALGANIASETVAGRQFATQSSSSSSSSSAASSYSSIHEVAAAAAAAAAATSVNSSSIYGGVYSTSIDRNTSGYHMQISPAAAAVAALHETANARNCALPSPTIYPPTPPPSAPWIHPHPWFGDTF